MSTLELMPRETKPDKLNLYVRSDEKEAIEARAERLGISSSQYLQSLARADIERGGDFVIPERKPAPKPLHPEPSSPDAGAPADKGSGSAAPGAVKIAGRVVRKDTTPRPHQRRRVDP